MLESCMEKKIICLNESETLREMFDKDAAMGVDGATCTRACTMKATGMVGCKQKFKTRINW